MSQLFGWMTSKHQILQVYGILFSRTLFWRNEPSWSILGATHEIVGSCPLRADSHLATGLENSFPPASHKGSFFPDSLYSRYAVCLTHEPHADRDSCQCGSTGDGKLTQSSKHWDSLAMCFVFCVLIAQLMNFVGDNVVSWWQFHVTVSKGLCLSTQKNPS